MNPTKHRVKQLRRDMRHHGLGRWEHLVGPCPHGGYPVSFHPVVTMPRHVMAQVLDLMAARWDGTSFGLVADSADLDDEWWAYYTSPTATRPATPDGWVPARHRIDA